MWNQSKNNSQPHLKSKKHPQYIFPMLSVWLSSSSVLLGWACKYACRLKGEGHVLLLPWIWTMVCCSSNSQFAKKNIKKWWQAQQPRRKKRSCREKNCQVQTIKKETIMVNISVTLLSQPFVETLQDKTIHSRLTQNIETFTDENCFLTNPTHSKMREWGFIWHFHLTQTEIKRWKLLVAH